MYIFKAIFTPKNMCIVIKIIAVPILPKKDLQNIAVIWSEDSSRVWVLARYCEWN